IGNPSLNHRYRKGFYSLFKTLQQNHFTPKFVKKYANLSEEMNKAFTKYIEEVKDGVFPGPEHGFKISDDVLEKLY
ncbi:3-methyl-2-oxobutanoate hydroxymethyltransferase, partial [Enterococcus faecium]